jgi:hypothetical protein
VIEHLTEVTPRHLQLGGHLLGELSGRRLGDGAWPRRPDGQRAEYYLVESAGYPQLLEGPTDVGVAQARQVAGVVCHLPKMTRGAAHFMPGKGDRGRR